MRAPELDTLRPGDFVKVRGSSSPLHNGGRAVVVAVHRDGPPWRVVALDVRYSARGAAVRVEMTDSGELARWETPWVPAHTVEDAPERHELLAPGTAHVETRGSRRTLLAAGLVVLAVVAGLGTWAHRGGGPDPDPVAVQRALREGARGTAGASPSLTATATASPTAVAATATVVAYAAGPVPVVAGPEGTSATPLAGVAEAPGCHDAYVDDLFSHLPTGQAVAVVGAGWYRTDDGLDVNAELVRRGVAVPVSATAGTSATDVRNFAELTELAAHAPRC
ncbi:hypothetical protein [Kineococcus aurantiacus]|uniref:Uncharacterized protein n=1 Tax=Kineococcus aurantiacus TaxID=37633 RepID=A0A7Y9DKM3_9ACTN|nr:hypothetical protein [Kineococcus aurantiacus]NYD22318.1 hypothetical protein [Kineococcus aurantiacus]